MNRDVKAIRRLTAGLALVLLSPLTGCAAPQPSPKVTAEATRVSTAAETSRDDTPPKSSMRVPQELLKQFAVNLPRSYKGLTYQHSKEWSSDTLWLRFWSERPLVTGFLDDLGMSRSDLAAGYCPIGSAEQEQAGWQIEASRKYAGSFGPVKRVQGQPIPSVVVVDHGGEMEEVYVVAGIT
jgi:hypothetical protein